MIVRRKLTTILTVFGSFISISFGIWHFFVPKIWNWYSYIDKTATELVLAVRAVNVFFSLLLVLLGLANILIITRKPQNRFSTIIILSVSTILWIVRVLLQIIYPQGSQNWTIQYGMLIVFILTSSCFIFSLLSTIRKQTLKTSD